MVNCGDVRVAELTAKIDKAGDLLVLRAGTWKHQLCPYDHDADSANCGDWCPLFHEYNAAWQQAKAPRWVIACDCGGGYSTRTIAEDLRERPAAGNEERS